MRQSATHTPPALRHRIARGGGRHARGFNFAEVLFAVMILGIGFIMVAAIFPVALQQTRVTGEEVVGSTVARGGVNYFEQVGLTPRALFATDLLLDIAPAPAWPNKIALVADPAPPTVPANGSLHVAGKMISFRDNRLLGAARDRMWEKVMGNLILPDDPRTAWVGMFRRGMTYTNTTAGPLAVTQANVTAGGITGTPDPFAHIVLIGVQSRNRSAYEFAKDARRYPLANDAAGAAFPVTGTLATLEPRLVFAKLTEGEVDAVAPGVDTVTFYTDAAGGTTVDLAVAAEGAYLVISDDQLADDPGTPAPQVELKGDRNGRVYRLGVKREDLGTGVWELALDGDLEYQPRAAGAGDDLNENIPARPITPVPADRNPAGLAAYAFIVGRGWSDPVSPGVYEGPAQDSGVYVGIVPAN